MLIQTKELTKTFGSKVAVNHLNISIKEGSLTAVLGPNGAGKTTTMSMLTGLLKPTSGTVEIAKQTKVSMVFQQSILDNNLTVKENLMIRRGLYKDCSKEHVNELIKQIDLTNFINQKYGSLSGGQRRRVDIARALINQPDVLFLDEPTTGLDIQTREAIWTLLHSLQEARHLTIILTTHYLEEADHSDEVYIIDHGSVIAEGSADEIKTSYSKNKLIIYTNHSQAVLDLIPAATVPQQTNDGITCWPSDSAQALDILTMLKAQITNFEYRSGTMNDAFLKLTGREMR
ncbi:daunorubicin/doxorubicin resistance ATP-binding protein DrrA [Lentilactobacillus sunkii]|uniref:Daunorubicin/doxorubicin resistance ATP-binding protein DrrA n=1 Tax=Lentilactobacillus sunkii TaxID=481719 RepID=A0A1E7XBK3_9LACO|nr:ABC transporter ATP-binding protein [Lentilactobacillus sunkii]OFA10494.1 daunorubicin/doxorubicin resistance ATP-binding protein DrrA [Lentilactobacillus sunkii]